MEWLVPAADGRTLAVEDAGDRGGRPVLVHVGTPGGRRLYGPRTLADAERRQLRLISYDPGAETWFFADEGHALRESHIEDVHAWLVARSS
jgi:pimeloyl-ACP methyl ester carboxylesterase